MKIIMYFCLFIIATVNGALAHSKKEQTTPQAGEVLTQSPDMIHMVFDDAMRITFARLVNAEGTEIPIRRSTGIEPSLEFHADLDPIDPGLYIFEWRGLAADGHAMQDQFSFELIE